MTKNQKGLTLVGEILPAIIKPELRPPSSIQERLLSMPADGEDASILYQHSVLCQTCMPYRDPGDTVRIWQRRNGIVRLELQAGRVLDPRPTTQIESAALREGYRIGRGSAEQWLWLLRTRQYRETMLNNVGSGETVHLESLPRFGVTLLSAGCQQALAAFCPWPFEYEAVHKRVRYI